MRRGDLEERVDEAGIGRLASAVGKRPIELLINNAGILLWAKDFPELDVAGIRKQFEVNALGPLRVTAALRDRLGKGSKVALVTSRMGSIDDNTSGGGYGYRMSKAALNMAGKSLAVDLKNAGVAVAILRTRALPGWTGYVFLIATVLLLGQYAAFRGALPFPQFLAFIAVGIAALVHRAPAAPSPSSELDGGSAAASIDRT